MVVRYDRAGLERFAEAYLGHPLRSCLHFAPCLDTQTLTGAMLVDQVKAAIAMVRRCAEGGAGALPVLLEGHLENALMAALMFFQPHDLSEDMARAVPGSYTQRDVYKRQGLQGGTVQVQRQGGALRGVSGRWPHQDRDALPARCLCYLRGMWRKAL